VRRGTAAVTALLLFATAACGTDDPDEANEQLAEEEDMQPPDQPEDPDADAVEGERPEGPDGTGDVEQQAIATAIQEGYQEGELEVVTVERVTWPDGALGCPQPGGMYTQALVEGYRVVLRAGDEELHFHGQEGQPPFLCEDPQEPVA
jgi:hypothetical protein